MRKICEKIIYPKEKDNDFINNNNIINQLNLELQSKLNSRNKKTLFENSFSVKSDADSSIGLGIISGNTTILKENNNNDNDNNFINNNININNSIGFLNESINEDSFNLTVKLNSNKLNSSINNKNNYDSENDKDSKKSNANSNIDYFNDKDNDNHNEKDNVFKRFFLDSIGNFKKKKFNNQKDGKNIKGNNNKDGTVIIKNAMMIKQGICYSKKTSTNK